jgi:uracil-DNA glycosylase family 4
MSVNRHDIISTAITYFKQQSELYGREFIFSKPETAETVRSSSCMNWEKLVAVVSECSKCALSADRHHVVFGTGNLKAKVMLIGEAPGEEEDRQGIPFVGKAGQLLDKILEAIDFKREEIYIANILKCRPPQNRDPVPDEIIQCLPYLYRQIQCIQPKLILVLGRIAAHALLNTQQSLTQLRGRQHTFQNIPLLVTYHPAALLRHTEWKRPVWEDVQKLRGIYDQLVGDKPKWKPVKVN